MACRKSFKNMLSLYAVFTSRILPLFLSSISLFQSDPSLLAHSSSLSQLSLSHSLFSSCCSHSHSLNSLFQSGHYFLFFLSLHTHSVLLPLLPLLSSPSLLSLSFFFLTHSLFPFSFCPHFQSGLYLVFFLSLPYSPCRRSLLLSLLDSLSFLSLSSVHPHTHSLALSLFSSL